MRPNLVVLGVIVLVLGFLGIFEEAAADTRRTENLTGLNSNPSDIEKTEVTRTVGWSRYYGRPIYRCRHFSSECYYFRPAHYVRHWSYSYKTNSRNQPSGDIGPVEGIATRRGTHTIKPVRYYINSKTLKSGMFTKAQNVSDKIHRGQKVAAYWVSGRFVRITSPGLSSRWIRADSPSLNRPKNNSTSDVSAKPSR